jgi:two-component system response regulator NreC
MPTRILIADDHGVLRAGLTAILNTEPDLQVVGEASNGEEALRLAAELCPDLVLMDISMSDVGGIESTRRMLELLPEVRVLMLSVHEDISLVREALTAGAVGYVPKRAVKSEMINAIHTVMRGDVYIHSALMRALLTETPKKPVPASTEVDVLTQRELDVLRLIIKGYTNSQIAELLHISVRTVEFHRANLTSKLNMRSRADLIRYASEHGIS